MNVTTFIYGGCPHSADGSQVSVLLAAPLSPPSVSLTCTDTCFAFPLRPHPSLLPAALICFSCFASNTLSLSPSPLVRWFVDDFVLSASRSLAPQAQKLLHLALRVLPSADAQAVSNILVSLVQLRVQPWPTWRNTARKAFRQQLPAATPEAIARFMFGWAHMHEPPPQWTPKVRTQGS